MLASRQWLRRGALLVPVETEPPDPPDPPSPGFAGPGTVGPYATVDDDDPIYGFGPHTNQAANMTNLGSANVNSSAVGQTIQLIRTTGIVTITHESCTVINVDARRIQWTSTLTTPPLVVWSRAVNRTGENHDGTNPSYRSMGTGSANVHRCEMAGYVDGVQIIRGSGIYRACWIHGGYKWNSDPGQGGGASHVDLIQFIPQDACGPWKLKDLRLDGWCWRQGTPGGFAGDWNAATEAGRQGTGYLDLTSSTRITQGILCKAGNTPSRTVDDIAVTGCLFDGNLGYVMQFLDGDTATAAPPPTNVLIEDNLFYPRFATYGANALIGYHAAGNITWRNNRDAVTNALIAKKPGMLS